MHALTQGQWAYRQRDSLDNIPRRQTCCLQGQAFAQDRSYTIHSIFVIFKANLHWKRQQSFQSISGDQRPLPTIKWNRTVSCLQSRAEAMHVQASAPADLADEEAGHDACDRRDDNEQPEEGRRCQYFHKEVVDGGRPLERQCAIADHVQEPHGCVPTTACATSAAGRERRHR